MTKSEGAEKVGINEVSLGGLAQRISQDIDSFTADHYNDGFRWHLGASKIGEECKRALWYSYRWVGGEKPDGRMQRLFNRGHLEEIRHREWLKAIGFNVWHEDTSQTKPDGSYPQYRIRNKCKGHLGGSLDGIVEFPARYKIDGYAILESKTSGTGAKFNELSKKPLSLVKPAHYIQNSIYGADYGIEHVLYICANKNDDSLHIDVVKLDFKLAQDMEAKAESIIFSQTPPQRISNNPTFFTCKSMCDYKDVCHFQKPALVNCRSCVKCSAVDAGEFFCSVYEAVIPRDVVAKGCPSWLTISIAE